VKQSRGDTHTPTPNFSQASGGGGNTYETDGAFAFFCFCNEYAISALQLYYTKFGFKVASAKEIESLRSQLADRMREIVDLKNTIQAINADYAKLNRDLQFTIKERNDLATKLKDAESKISQLQEQLKKIPTPSQLPTALPTARQLPTALPTIDETRIREIVREELSAGAGSGIPVDVTLKRALSEFNVSIDKEVLEVDESSWVGKILARGLAGFFQEEQGFGSIMSELERVYSASRTSGGTRDAVQKALEELCAKGILDRQQKANQWGYRESAGFKERVKKT